MPVLRCLLPVVLVVSACGAALPTPAFTTHPFSAYVAIPYPPPAALAETVPERPNNPDAVWLDGEWNYQGPEFIWRRGGWVIPPRLGRFAPWQIWYRSDGRLMMASGGWYDGTRKLPSPVMLRSASAPPNEVTSEFQTGR
jgi:hypothetical protein